MYTPVPYVQINLKYLFVQKKRLTKQMNSIRFVNTIRLYLQKLDLLSERNEKVKEIIKMMDFIQDNKEIIEQPRFDRFKQVVYKKLIQFRDNNRDVINIEPYLESIYGYKFCEAHVTIEFNRKCHKTVSQSIQYCHIHKAKIEKCCNYFEDKNILIKDLADIVMKYAM